ncbi:MAG: diguanylate cyclase [Clostridiales bacterium]|jgi:diguanylate cyclase (GGDEF)-like protein|nr:diguanylate cyclase [Clostridiales bacterium]
MPDSGAAGKQALEKAIRQSHRTDPCDMVWLFCTARHDQQILFDAVSAAAGVGVPVYGGGAIGVITNNNYGYAGDQVGVACFWLDGVSCDVLTDNGLLEREEETGFRLGQGLADLSVSRNDTVLLFYEAVGRNDAEGIRLHMATWLLAGLEKSLGFLPNIIGAGFLADFDCSVTKQFVGDATEPHNAMAFSFGKELRIDSVVMHGCVPASEYYTVTKADGPVILEINDQPALSFMDALLHSSIKPEQYPFFLLFGINFGERWNIHNGENYASRLCLGIDRDRDGIIMFEPDMVAGTEFQVLFRATDLRYMQPKLQSVFDRLNGRKPVFALYINCGGRCAGYSGTDAEDALVLQEFIGDRVPLLGFYSGVEIAPMAGRPRELDWSGVFCLFSQGEETAVCADSPFELTTQSEKKTDDTACSPNVLSDLNKLNVARKIALDMQFLGLRYELELKRRGFRLLSELSISLRQTEDYEDIFVHVAQRINAALNMQKTIVLTADGMGSFVPDVLQGFSPADKSRLKDNKIVIPPELLSPMPVLAIDQTDAPHLLSLRQIYDLPYFIFSPIMLQDEVIAVLMTGRMAEAEPYLTRLGNSDMETVQAITELLSTVLLRLRLRDATARAEVDGLTQLLNRNALQQKVEAYLAETNEAAGMFMMLDIDHFKTINDTYGHSEGDRLLKACAEGMRLVLRESDIIGRQGGDEFVIFCQGIKDYAIAERKAKRLAEVYRRIAPAETTNPVTVSIGIAFCPQHGTTFQKLYETADKALYEAKKRGRDCFVFYDNNSVTDPV